MIDPVKIVKDELRKRNVWQYEIKLTAKGHSQVLIPGCPIIVIGAARRTADNRLEMNIRRDIVKALALQNTGSKSIYSRNGTSQK